MTQLARNGNERAANQTAVIVTSEQTAQCGEETKRALEAAGWNVRLFLVEAEVENALQVTTTEPIAGIITLSLASLADSLLGGTTPGANWLDVVAVSGVPAVVAPGDLDSVRFGALDSVPLHLRRRKLHAVSSERTLLRTDVTENARLGRLLAEKMNVSTGPVALCMPLRGLSALDAPQGPFYSVEARMALFGNLTTHLRRDIPLYEGNVDINAPAFAQLCAETLQTLIRG